jgi:nicotinamide mononucleotide (NMN) deamidase PncC
MAGAIRRRSGADLGVAVDGELGHKHGRPDSTLWVAVADGHGTTSRTLGFGFDHARMRKLAAWVALEQLRRAMGQLPVDSISDTEPRRGDTR